MPSALTEGIRVTGRKIFGSGSPMGDLLLTSAPFVDPNDGQLCCISRCR